MDDRFFLELWLFRIPLRINLCCYWNTDDTDRADLNGFIILKRDSFV
ncbi:hypothetical protein HNQ02_003212 [Flavobacterium sp. 7E]|nr:hypothetical protein [Flavobacterium sp. 7E]